MAASLAGGFVSVPAFAKSSDCASLLESSRRARVREELRVYGVDPGAVRFTASGKPIVLLGKAESGFNPPPVTGVRAIRDPRTRDILVVGAGLAGSVASVYASDDPKRTVLALETQKEAGGLAHGITLRDPDTGKAVPLDNGAAYWAPPDREEFKNMQHVGLTAYKRFAIPEHIDTYLLYGKLYPGIWDTETVKELPKDFMLFKFVLRRLDRMGLTPKQPMNADKDPLHLDRMSTAEFIRKMPALVQDWIRENPRDTVAKHALAEFLDAEGDKPDPMSNVLALMDNYCRSAHGATAERIDAHEFLNFYVSELQTRYTGPLGTGEISSRALKKLAGRENFELKTSAQVIRIEHEEGGAKKVTYLQGGQLREVIARKVVFTAPMKLAPKLIEGYAHDRPEAVDALGRIENSNYMVINVVLDGRIDRQKLPGYDIWLGPPRDREGSPTDVINATWTLPESERPARMDALTIYLPLGKSGSGFTDAEALERTERAMQEMLEKLGPYLQTERGRPLKPKFAVATRWPLSIPVNGPGHAEVIDTLTRSYRGIYFGGLGLDTPSVEAGLYYGKKAAEDAIRSLRRRR